MELLSYAFDSTCTFNFKKCIFRIAGREFSIVTGDSRYCDVIHTITDNANERDVVFQLIFKFLHRFGWTNGCSFNFKQFIAQGIPKRLDLSNIKRRLEVNRKYRNLVVNFRNIVLPVNSEQEIALSLFNDAEYSEDLFYRFLCYWKIIEINYPGRKKLSASKWINNKLLEGTVRVPDYLQQFSISMPSLGDYLYRECRNAITHITRKPTVISYKSTDWEKIGKACAIIEPFVEYFIRDVLNIPKRYDNIDVLTIEQNQPTTSWLNHELFTREWLGRAERKEDDKIDMGDRFISLWIAFNGWMRGKYGESGNDRYLLNRVKLSTAMKEIYHDLKITNKDFDENLRKIKQFTVLNMKFSDDESDTKKFDDTFESLIEVIYQIRCNLFHGRKELSAYKEDFELVCLAYVILLPLFKGYLGKHGYE